MLWGRDQKPNPRQHFQESHLDCPSLYASSIHAKQGPPLTGWHPEFCCAGCTPGYVHLPSLRGCWQIGECALHSGGPHHTYPLVLEHPCLVSKMRRRE